MSQQEVQFENTQQGEAGSYHGGYDGLPYYTNDYQTNHDDQKITGQGGEKPSPNTHLREHMLNLRMGMAVTSLVLWMGFFLISIAILINSPNIVQPFIYIGLAVFTILVVLANVLINRKQL